MNLPLAPLAAALLGGVAALCVVALPGGVVEGLVMDSGLPAVLPQAEPPLGTTARVLLALGAGGLVAAFAWLALFVVVGTRGIDIGTAADDTLPFDDEDLPTPVIRRADAHPDAPPRPPLLATRDLGTPFLEVRAPVEPGPRVTPTVKAPPVERALPDNFDQPLAAFDPEAIRDVPMEAPVAVAPLSPKPRPPVFDETKERFEVFELTPPTRPAPPPPAPAPEPAPVRQEAIARPETEASVHALLERLERGVIRSGLAARRPVPTARETERGLEEALVTLRNLARRA